MNLQQQRQEVSEEKESKSAFSLEKVAELTEMLAKKTEAAINQIDRINGETQVLSINALIEASRAGEVGKTFSVVAEEMSKLSKKIEDTTENLRRESIGTMAEMGEIIRKQITNIRGIRLSDLALTNIDLVDRSLYERSCDVRWWAKDNSLVDALVEKSKNATDLASHRLGVILDSYTVYFDLVLCDSAGNVIANGRPSQFASIGKNQSETAWFRSGLEANSKGTFGFQTVHRCPLVNNQLAVMFSCAVQDTSEEGTVLGTLGVIFNWEALAQKIIENTPLSDEEKSNTRIYVVDPEGLILADSCKKVLEGRIQFSGVESLFAEKKGFTITNYENSEYCIAHAYSPGYETYSSGWHSLIMQKLVKKSDNKQR
jgi:hypothetical protein